MQARTAILFLGVLSFGCGGRLVGSGGENSEDTGTAVSGCGDAGPFVGTWTCNYTAVSLIPPPPGSTNGVGTGARPFTFAESDGGLVLTLGESSAYPDGGPDAAPTCAGLTFTVSGDTATLDGQQSCWGAYVDSTMTFASGTFTVSGCSAATYGDLVSSGTADPNTYPEPFSTKENGTCTRN